MNRTSPFRSTMNVDGMLPGCHRLATALSASHTRGKSAPRELVNSGMPPLSSSSEKPTTTSPLDRYLVLRAWSLGNDLRHGSHHVAQKSTMTTLPPRPAIEIFPLPFAESRANGGAGLPIRGWVASLALAASNEPPPQPTDSAAKGAESAAPRTKERAGRHVDASLMTHEVNRFASA